MQIKVVNANLQVRYQKVNNKLIVINDKYNVHLKLFANKRKQHYVMSCKVKDKQTKRIICTKLFYFDRKVDLKQMKNQILDRNIPKELKEIEKYIVVYGF